jgi:hypothetical protein
MPNAARGYTTAVIESTFGGMQPLLADTAVSALPASLTSSTALTAANTGMMLLIIVYGHTASGTIGIAGTAPLSLAAVTSTTTTLEVRPQGDNPYAVYLTPEVYGAVSASGVTLGSGLTNGRIVIYGIQAPTRLIPGEIKINDKRKDYHVVQQRGTFAQSHMAPLVLTWEPDVEISADLQPDSTFLLLPTGFSSTVTTTALPVGGTVLLASTSVVTGSTVSATTQPTVPGMVVQITLAGGPATAATCSITGTNLDDEVVTEVVIPSSKTAQIYTSKTVWKTIAASGIAFGAFGGSATITVTGYFGWQFVAIPNDPMASVSLYQWDSVANKLVPWFLCNEWEINWGQEKEAKVALKGPAQIVGLVGDVSNANQQGPAVVQSQDLAITGWSSVIYIDPLAGPAGTTLAGSTIEGKMMGKNNWTTIRTAQFYPPYAYFTRAYHNRHEFGLELTLDMLIADYQVQYTGAWKKGTKQIVVVHIRHPNPICTIAGVPYYLGPKIAMTARWEEDPQLKYEIGSPNVQITLKATAWWDAPSGYDAQLTWVSRSPSWS